MEKKKNVFVFRFFFLDFQKTFLYKNEIYNILKRNKMFYIT